MVMVVDQSEETSTKKKTKKGKKVKIAGTAAQEGSGGMANGGGEETADSAAMGAVQDGAVMEDPETLARFEVGWPLAKEGVLTFYFQIFSLDFFTQSLDPSEMANGVTAASADEIQDHLAQGRT